MIRVSIPDLIQKAVYVLRVHFSAVMKSSAPPWGAHGRIFIDEFPHQGQRNDWAEGAVAQKARGSVIRPNRASS